MIQESFQVGSHPRLRISIPSGRIEIRGTTERRIDVKVDSDDPHFEVSNDGDSVRLVSESRRGGWFSKGSRVSVSIPDGTDVTISTGAADITCDTKVGRLDVSTASGDVQVAEAAEMTIKTASGDIVGGVVTGHCKVVSASGDLRLRRTAGRVSCSTASGDIDIAEALGEVSVNTASGDCRIGSMSGPGLDANSMSGNIRVGLPPRTRVDLDATTLSGDVRVPDRDGGGEAPVRSVRIKARLVSGDLTLERAG